MPSKLGPSNRGKLIRVTDETYAAVELAATREQRTRSMIVARAVAAYLGLSDGTPAPVDEPRNVTGARWPSYWESREKLKKATKGR